MKGKREDQIPEVLLIKLKLRFLVIVTYPLEEEGLCDCVFDYYIK